MREILESYHHPQRTISVVDLIAVQLIVFESYICSSLHSLAVVIEVILGMSQIRLVFFLSDRDPWRSV